MLTNPGISRVVGGDDSRVGGGGGGGTFRDSTSLKNSP